MAALPAIDGPFIYNGELYADVGNMNRHKRAPVDEIKKLLRPDLKKKNAAVAPSKDPVAHWWEAQLIHYGLPSTKDKARAKMRLLDALNNAELSVPAKVQTIEANLVKAFAAGSRKGKEAKTKTTMATNGKTKTPAAAAGTKRKAADDTASGVPAKAKKQQQARDSPVKGTKESTAPKTKAKSSTANPPLAAAAPPSRPPTQFATKQTARKQTSRNHGPQPPYALNRYPRLDDGEASEDCDSSDLRSVIEIEDEPKVKVKKESKPNVKKEVSFKKDSKPRVKEEKAIKQEQVSQASPSRNTSIGLINGVYDITCPSIEAEWPDFCRNGLDLTLTLDSPAIWGAYDFGMFSGILYIPERPFSANEGPKEFTWRGRENSEGEISFGEYSKGEIRFLGTGRIQGWINVYGRCEFEGRRQPGPGNAVRAAAGMRAEWDSFNEDEYERERVGRWH